MSIFDQRQEYIVGARAKSEMYQDEMRMKVTSSRLADVDYAKYGNDLYDRCMKDGTFGEFTGYKQK